jgi:hypothetical protein
VGLSFDGLAGMRRVTLVAFPLCSRTFFSHGDQMPKYEARRSYAPGKKRWNEKRPSTSVSAACGCSPLPDSCTITRADGTGLSSRPYTTPSIVLVTSRGFAGAVTRHNNATTQTAEINFDNLPPLPPVLILSRQAAAAETLRRKG